MLTLISPAKKLNNSYDSNIKANYTIPEYLNDSYELIDILKKFSVEDIKNLMGVSDNISELNFKRYQEFNNGKYELRAIPAILAFAGEVYNGLDVKSFNEKEFEFINENLRILSGLYGVLKPLDFMREYRLEMGTSLKNKRGKNLYEFWKEKVTSYINDLESELIVNLASTEYFSVLDKKKLKADIITPVFKDYKSGDYKVIMMYAKNARGLMSNYIVKNEIKDWQKLKEFDIDGYSFDESNSILDSKNKILTFTRKK
jgi:cytoplasmic iron level regulating protein YaaA (DUF328/UPF0246 family)